MPTTMVQADDFPDPVLISDRSEDFVRPFRSSLLSDMVVYLVITALVVVAWQFSQLGVFEAGDDVGYWLGVAGGVMMLLLFSYPLRKHYRFARNWGRMKWWLWVHMLLGVGGPVLILLHSTFRVGSLNAAVALYSMVIVGVSGVIGRFIYTRVNRGLHGEQANLKDLKLRAGLQQSDFMSKLAFAPRVEARLMAFEQAELKSKPGWLTYARQVFWLPVQQWLIYRECVSDIHGIFKDMALRDPHRDFHKHEKNARKFVCSYLNAVTRVAQFVAYERLFSLWHVAHIPFVYLLVISAVVHVFAVHVY